MTSALIYALISHNLLEFLGKLGVIYEVIIDLVSMTGDLFDSEPESFEMFQD